MFKPYIMIGVQLIWSQMIIPQNVPNVILVSGDILLKGTKRYKSYKLFIRTQCDDNSDLDARIGVEHDTPI